MGKNPCWHAVEEALALLNRASDDGTLAHAQWGVLGAAAVALALAWVFAPRQ